MAMRARTPLSAASFLLLAIPGCAAGVQDPGPPPEEARASAPLPPPPVAGPEAPAAAGDIGELADAAARAGPTRDPAELVRRLDLLVRAGHEADAIPVLDALRAADPPVPDVAIERFAHDWIVTGRDDLAMRLIERFPGTRSRATFILLERRALADGWETVDRWAAEREPANPDGWLRERLQMREKFGTARLLLDEVAAAARKTPADMDGFLRWIEAGEAVSPRPDASWIAACAEPVLAFDGARLGRRLHEGRAFAAAVRILDRSLATPFTPADADALRAWFREHQARMRPGPDTDGNWEAILRRTTRFALADSLLGSGEAARAQTVLEALAADAEATGDLPDLFLAGRIQAGSGARVIEKRVLAAEVVEADTADYWRHRVAYFKGRKEPDRVREATAGLLAVIERKLPSVTWGSAPDQRLSLVEDKASAVGLLSGKRAAFDVLHGELAPLLDAKSEEWRLLYGLAYDYAEFLDAEDPVLWRYLGERADWSHAEHRLLMGLAASLDGSSRDSLWTRAEALAASGPPERGKELGRVMTATGAHARAVEVLRSVVGRLTDPEARRSAAFSLLGACEGAGDWRGAEAAWRLLLENAGPGALTVELRQWAGKPALTAARAGAADDALRLWAAKVDLDRGEFSDLDRLRKLGLGERLRAFYGDLVARDPGAAPCVARALAVLGD